MIYHFPGPDDPLRQGDIFFTLPRIEFSLDRVLCHEPGGALVESDWDAIAEVGKPAVVLVGVRPTLGIIASQDCDLAHSHDVTFCEIRQFRDVEKKCKETTAAKSWKSLITQHARINLKWFYLPPDRGVGFQDKMAVDFQVVFRIPRIEVERRRASLRKGRLNDLSEAHFRERISEFFRRYAYDEWYPLNAEELQSYKSEYPDAKPFPWQEGDPGH